MVNRGKVQNQMGQNTRGSRGVKQEGERGVSGLRHRRCLEDGIVEPRHGRQHENRTPYWRILSSFFSTQKTTQIVETAIEKAYRNRPRFGLDEHSPLLPLYPIPSDAGSLSPGE